ncbi:hypothetical protein PS928_02323 [Pseudomonas fluorescens]|uniref:HTH deoR-type domain-containing protein n=1 Tax=Pseudomonas fluorescens TaxID=294 RepID=A0A5E7THK9_PSEFL|nr:hypothetical protein PS928_02323 [Pseudomonas fluorescens]
MQRQLRKHQVLSVHQLMDMLDCSHMTIRRDIALLEQEGRAYSELHSEPRHQLKAVVELPQKQAMAKLAAGLLHADMTIYLDAGTSTLEIVPYIKALSGMTVVTNDFGINSSRAAWSRGSGLGWLISQSPAVSSSSSSA